jgi:hypothetical protein
MGQHTPDQWRNIGLQIGRERGLLDALAGEPRKPDQLWIPDGAHPAYVEALREGYLEAVAGDVHPLGI